MQIGYLQINIEPTFPVNRMLKEEKHQKVADSLNCRILALINDNETPFYHVSIDTVEIWKEVEDRIIEVIEKKLNAKINCICSATHSHNCPCMTTDDAYVDFVVNKIEESVDQLELKTYKKVEYNYNYSYFDQVGKSRIVDHTTAHVYAETVSLYGDGKRIVTFLIHNVHPTIKELWVDDFTSEYPGYCMRKLSEQYPDEHFTFLLGPAGDTSPHFVRKGRDYNEMLRLAELLKCEFDRQLKSQKQEDNKTVELSYEEIVIPNLREQFDASKIDMPEHPNEDDIKVMESINKPRKFKRELRDFEFCNEHHLAHLIFSKDYSMIFEPFELYSEYYGAVDKSKCSVISISKGFDHYLTGLYLNHLSMHGSLNDFSIKTKKRMWEILNRWSRQEKA